ncbi:uncharacterized protein LOC107400947 isoform X2 [Peromyscus maniculatus bairdii]|uniref:uncharacterized protein LOC107400947 isoform X2 n=1 Tax=Peromyscus maniculatus bairdii TaxID=230844 RepID=UPI003FD5A19C
MDWESTPVPGTQLEDSELKENFKLTYFYGLSFSCRERIFKKDFEGETLNGAEEPEKNKDQGMQKLYLPKTSRGNRAVQGMCATRSRCVFPQPDQDNAYKGMLRSPRSRCSSTSGEVLEPYELGSCGRKKITLCHLLEAWTPDNPDGWHSICHY